MDSSMHISVKDDEFEFTSVSKNMSDLADNIKLVNFVRCVRTTKNSFGVYKFDQCVERIFKIPPTKNDLACGKGIFHLVSAGEPDNFHHPPPDKEKIEKAEKIEIFTKWLNARMGKK